jgi:hypothetical protein
VTEHQTVGLPAAVCFTLFCTLVLAYVVIARPGVQDPTTDAASAGNQRPVGNVQLPGSLEERNQQRLDDLKVVATMVRQYAEEHHSYPSTGGRLQTLCVYRELDAGCAFTDQFETLPSDPAGAHAGYFYQSDGKSFIVVAQWEGGEEPPDDFKCPAGFQHIQASKTICLPGLK